MRKQGDEGRPLGDRAQETWWGLGEVIVLIIVAVILAGLLLPHIEGHSRSADVARTRRLLCQLASALEAYRKDSGCYPPDTMPSGVELHPLDAGQAPTRLTTRAQPPEALHHYLTHPRLGPHHPYLTLDSRWAADLDGDGLPEIVDAWGHPFLYNRPRFPSGGFDNGTDPFHNTDSFDLYSVGHGGQTGTSPLPDPRKDLAGFCKKAMDEALDGEGKDDIANWR